MKSLVALLDRKKRDRAATLIPVSHSSSLHPAALPQQERQSALAGTHRPRAQSSSLQPPLLQRRAVSNSDLSQRPLLFPESTPHSRGESPAQSTSYYTESDDDILADPFAASSPSRHNPLRCNLFPTIPDQGASPTTAVAPNIARTAPPSAFQNNLPLRNNRAEWEPSASHQRAVDHTLSRSKANSSEAAPNGKRGRWLRERRSFSNFLRPQVSVQSVSHMSIASLTRFVRCVSATLRSLRHLPCQVMPQSARAPFSVDHEVEAQLQQDRGLKGRIQPRRRLQCQRQTCCGHQSPPYNPAAPVGIRKTRLHIGTLFARRWNLPRHLIHHQILGFVLAELARIWIALVPQRVCAGERCLYLADRQSQLTFVHPCRMNQLFCPPRVIRA